MSAERRARYGVFTPCQSEAETKDRSRKHEDGHDTRPELIDDQSHGRIAPQRLGTRTGLMDRRHDVLTKNLVAAGHFCMKLDAQVVTTLIVLLKTDTIS